MGPEERQQDSDLSAELSPEDREKAALKGKLTAYAGRAQQFNYYRLLYLLERLFPKSPRLGHTGPSRDERIRLRPDPALTFASSDISELEYKRGPDEQERVQVTAAFMGLYGSTSPMPAHFVEEIALNQLR